LYAGRLMNWLRYRVRTDGTAAAGVEAKSASGTPPAGIVGARVYAVPTKDGAWRLAVGEQAGRPVVAVDFGGTGQAGAFQAFALGEDSGSVFRAAVPFVRRGEVSGFLGHYEVEVAGLGTATEKVTVTPLGCKLGAVYFAGAKWNCRFTNVGSALGITPSDEPVWWLGTKRLSSKDGEAITDDGRHIGLRSTGDGAR